MSPSRSLLLAMVLWSGGCDESASADEAAATATEEAGDQGGKKKERLRLPGPPRRSYEHPEVPYTDAEKTDLKKICAVLLDCTRSRCTKAKVTGMGTDYGNLLATFIKTNDPKRASRRVAELLKEDNLTSIDPACRQLVATVL
jgi:hypothetical protein